MASSESKTTKSRYTPSPHLPNESVAIYETMVRVMSGTESVSAAAASLGMARNQFQTAFHKAQGAFIAALPAGRTGRPKHSETERIAKATIAKQRRQLERLTEKNAVLEARLEAMSELVRAERTRPSTTHRSTRSRPRSRRSRSSSPTTKSATTTSSDGDGERDCARRRALALARRLESLGCRRERASHAAGVPASTMRRWRRSPPPTRAPRSRVRPTCAAGKRNEVAKVVRESKGQFGCEAIRRRVGGVSRRDVMAIKTETLSKMERERKDEATRVIVTMPGVVRGFDAMHLRTHDGSAYALRAQDAAVPFTTSLLVVREYDGQNVARALERDFAEHGVPYVLRMDRAACHRGDPVKPLLDAARVLVLHGPPRFPRFYGQLERPHVDYRVFAPAGECRTIREHASELERVRVLLNCEWCRRSLDYNTAETSWNSRVVPALDRLVLREEVEAIGRKITAKRTKFSEDTWRRFAIQATLIRHKLLRLVPGGYR